MLLIAFSKYWNLSKECIITLTSGALSIPFWNFLIAAILSRGLRFYLVGFLVWKYGEKVINTVDKKLNLISFCILVL